MPTALLLPALTEKGALRYGKPIMLDTGLCNFLVAQTTTTYASNLPAFAPRPPDVYYYPSLPF